MQKANSFSAVAQINEGLRAYMLRVYNYMIGGLALSGLAAFVASRPPLFNLLYTLSPEGRMGFSLLGIVVLIAPFILVFMFGSAVRNLNVGKAQAIFWIFSALMGLSSSAIFLAYPSATLTQAFLISAGSFAGLSLYGYTTKKDLSPMGSFLIMGLFGLIITMVVNIFLASPAIDYAVCLLGVGIFAGLTAYDTQRIRQVYGLASSEDQRHAMAISGALSLYLDFINLFLMLLRLMGNNRR